MSRGPGMRYNLIYFSELLQHEAWCQDSGGQVNFGEPKLESRQKAALTGNIRSFCPATVLHSIEDASAKHTANSSLTKPEGTHQKKIASPLPVL